jgi:hypothetical protein
MKKTTTKTEINKQKQVQKLQNVINVFLDDKKKKAKAKKRRRKKKMASIVKPDMRYTLPTINFLLNPPPPNTPQPFIPFPPQQPFRGDIRSPQMGLDTSIPGRIGSEPVSVLPEPEPERITPEPEPERVTPEADPERVTPEPPPTPEPDKDLSSIVVGDERSLSSYGIGRLMTLSDYDGYEESKTEPEPVLTSIPSPQQRSLDDIIQSRDDADETKQEEGRESMPSPGDLRLGRITSNRSVISTPETQVEKRIRVTQKIYNEIQKLDSVGIEQAREQLMTTVKTKGKKLWVKNPFTNREIQEGSDYYNNILNELNRRRAQLVKNSMKTPPR